MSNLDVDEADSDAKIAFSDFDEADTASSERGTGPADPIDINTALYDIQICPKSRRIGCVTNSYFLPHIAIHRVETGDLASGLRTAFIHQGQRYLTTSHF